MTGRPRLAPEQRKDRYRRYPGEAGYKPPKPKRTGNGVQKASRTPRKRARRAPRCDFPSLGPAVWMWATQHWLVPDGPAAGAPMLLTGD